MSIHIETVKKAIEFRKPSYLPMETNQVPHIYDAYHTLDPSTVKLIPGTEDFDAIWLSYNWFYNEIGKSDQGEVIYLDQWGTKLKIPANINSNYILLEHPLEKNPNYKEYKFPDPKDVEGKYVYLKKVIDKYYSDRFLNCFIDAGFYLTTSFILGVQNFFIKIATDLDIVIDIYEKVIEYNKQIALYYKNSGAHMVTVLEDWGMKTGLVINPAVWRKEFKPRLKKYFNYIHELNLYTSLLVDGNSEIIHMDLLEMDIDVVCIVDINSITGGIKKVKENLAGKICLKATVDMQDTLAVGTPEEVKKEADELVKELSTPDGGFICEVVKWYRPTYKDENVNASVEAFNKYRR